MKRVRIRIGKRRASSTTSKGRLRNHIASNAIAYVALFAALSGTATASHLAVRSSDIVNGQVKNADIGSNAVTSAKVADDQIKNADIGSSAVTSAKVADDSLTGGDIASGSVGGLDITDESISGGDVSDGALTGGDINEPTLDKVPSARSADMGGTGRFAFEGSCDPETETFVDCTYLNPLFPLTGAGRVLLVATVDATSEQGADVFMGRCRLEVNGTPYPSTETPFQEEDLDEAASPATESATLVAVTDVLSAGNNSVGVECNQSASAGAIWYPRARIVAVWLSAN